MFRREKKRLQVDGLKSQWSEALSAQETRRLLLHL